ncbi:MAG: FprA family A-type flavoprotein [Bacteroidales bacterium]|nr:FprA family A-type flavoprotein [Bacteroidales bacterium]MBK8883483.1 FprA family A-type flavoprotein [Bacteroidales bacterium]
MKTDNKILSLTESVKWIGVLDYDIRTFDIVMHTEYGTTYNSYFINAEKKAIVEVAKEKFSETYLAKLRTVTDPGEIEYIILNHTEPDHSGSLSLLLELAPSATVVGSGNAIRYLEDMVNVPFKSLVVKHGDKLDLGNKTLSFIAAPNLHWPDSMFTLLEEEKVLFTCDSFGAHYCSEDLYSDFSGPYAEAFKYYFDVIMRPFSRFMTRAIDLIRPMDIELICPGHGPVHSQNNIKVMDLSESYANDYLKLVIGRSPKNILIAYVSAYGYTSQAAEYIAEGILEVENIKTEILDIENLSLEALESSLITADGILIGSPTINQNTLLPVYKLFSMINPIRDKGKLGGAFGSYGWSGESPKIILENLRLLKLKIFEDTAHFKFSPSGDKIAFLKDFGKRYALKFKEECGA